MPLRGVIFDVDGTLVDSNDAHARSWVEALAEFGIEVPFESVRSRIGKGGDKLLPEVSGISEEDPLGREISARRSALFKERYLPGLQAFPGARELLLRLRDERLTLAVATSAKEDELRPLLEKTGAPEVFAETTSSSDAGRSKPDPDVVRAALDGAGLEPAEAVMIGDTPYDVEAAARSGVPVLAFRCGGWQDRDLAGAAAIYDGPADLLARFDDSLLARREVVTAS